MRCGVVRLGPNSSNLNLQQGGCQNMHAILYTAHDHHLSCIHCKSTQENIVMQVYNNHICRFKQELRCIGKVCKEQRSNPGGVKW